MPRKPPMSEAQREVLRLHKKGYSDPQIAKASGRSTDLIRLIRIGKKPGNNLAGPLKAINSRARSDGRALKPVEAPRRKQAVRGKSKTSAGPGRTLYEGKSAGPQLFDRIFAAGRRGQSVSLTVVWQDLRRYRRKTIEHNVPLVLFENLDAFEAIERLDAAGWDASHTGALANIATQNPDIEFVNGFRGYQLLTRDGRDEIQWEDA